MTKIEKIISGGQTGVDRAALDVASELGIPCGGWCPLDRWSEDGPIEDRYPLTETESSDPAVRTEWNVRDAHGTLIIATGPITGGTALTRRLAAEFDKPHLVVDTESEASTPAIREWLTTHAIKILHVAGPRESSRPGIYERAAALLRAVLG